jgi:hypothetical protein
MGAGKACGILPASLQWLHPPAVQLPLSTQSPNLLRLTLTQLYVSTVSVSHNQDSQGREGVQTTPIDVWSCGLFQDICKKIPDRSFQGLCVTKQSWAWQTN